MMDPVRQESLNANSKLRHKLQEAEEDNLNSSMLRTRVKNLAKSAKLYAEVGAQLNVFSDRCASEILALGQLDKKNLQLYKMFGETLKELENMRRIVMEQMDLLLAVPLNKLAEQTA